MTCANGGFPVTRHSAIERIRDADPDDAARGVRRPRRGLLEAGLQAPAPHVAPRPEDARDLTQGFFADAFQKAWLERYEPGKAKFRTFVRVCADRFVMNMRQSSARLKRGGGVQTLPLDFDGAEREVARECRRRRCPSRKSSSTRSSCARSSTRSSHDLRRGVRRARTADSIYRSSSATTSIPSRASATRSWRDEFGLTAAQVTNNLAQVRRRFRERALDGAARAVRQRPGVPPRGARSLWTGGRVTASASGLSDAAVTRLRTLGRWPEFESGRYSVTEEIGRGGMGTVFLAVDEELGREVAIKIPNALASDDLERRLRSEARVLAHARTSRHRADSRRRPARRRPLVLCDEARQGPDAARSRRATCRTSPSGCASSSASASRSRSRTRRASSIAISSRRTSWWARSAK